MLNMSLQNIQILNYVLDQNYYQPISAVFLDLIRQRYQETMKLISS